MKPFPACCAHIFAKAALAGVVLLPHASTARASERHFAYAYESNVLAPGERELEVWTTPRYGRDRFYARLDQRVEFEFGVLPRLQTALYINGTGVTKDTEQGRTNAFEFKGISNEWKYKLLDSVADPVGLATYAEFTLSPAGVEFEAKLIMDKRVRNMLFVLNVIAEREWEWSEDPERVWELELDAGLMLLLTPRAAVGMEMRQVNLFADAEGYESSGVFAGPTVSYVGRNWWVTASFMPQLASFLAQDRRIGLDLHDHERAEARVLLGFEL